MMLLTKGIEKALPEIGSKWDNPDPTVVTRFFTP